MKIEREMKRDGEREIVGEGEGDEERERERGSHALQQYDKLGLGTC